MDYFSWRFKRPRMLDSGKPYYNDAYISDGALEYVPKEVVKYVDWFEKASKRKRPYCHARVSYDGSPHIPPYPWEMDIEIQTRDNKTQASYSLKFKQWPREFVRMLMDFELDQKFIDAHKAAGKKLPFNVEGHRKAILEEKKQKQTEARQAAAKKTAEKRAAQNIEVSPSEKKNIDDMEKLTNLGAEFSGVDIYAAVTSGNKVHLYTNEGYKIGEATVTKTKKLNVMNAIIEYVAKNPMAAENIPNRLLANCPNLMTKVVDEMFLQVCGGPDMSKLQDKSVEELEAIKIKLTHDKQIIIETEKRKMLAIEEEKTRQQAEIDKKKSLISDIMGLRISKEAPASDEKDQMGGE